MPSLTSQRFKSLVRAKQALPADVVLHKQMSSVVQPMADRQLRFVISTAGIDRDGDVIDQDGWELINYRANPVVLWAHDASHMPLAKAVEIDVIEGKLCATVEFVPADVPHVGEKAEAALRLYKLGFMSAVSVGFRPLEFEVAKDRADEDDWFPPFNFKRQELMEFSLVTVPANPEALILVPETTADLLAQQSADDQAALVQERAAADAVQKQAEAEELALEAAKRAAAARSAYSADLMLALGLRTT